MKTLPTGMTPLPVQGPDGWSGDKPWFSPGGFLFDPRSGLTYTLNPTAAFIYERLGEGVGINEIVRGLVERYEVEESVARMDLQDLLGQMRALGLH